MLEERIAIPCWSCGAGEIRLPHGLDFGNRPAAQPICAACSWRFSWVEFRTALLIAARAQQGEPARRPRQGLKYMAAGMTPARPLRANGNSSRE